MRTNTDLAECLPSIFFKHVCNASCVDASRNYSIGRTHRGLCAHACTPIIRLTGLASRDSEGTHRGQYARRSRGRRAASTAATSHDHGGVSALCVPVHQVRADLQAPRDVLRRHGAPAEADRCQGNTLGLNSAVGQAHIPGTTPRGPRQVEILVFLKGRNTHRASTRTSKGVPGVQSWPLCGSAGRSIPKAVLHLLPSVCTGGEIVWLGSHARDYSNQHWNERCPMYWLRWF